VRSGGIGGEGFVFLPLLWRRGPEASTARHPAGWLVVGFFHVPAASDSLPGGLASNCLPCLRLCSAIADRPGLSVLCSLAASAAGVRVSVSMFGPSSECDDFREILHQQHTI
jgi:hypothetical protein